MDIYFTNTLTKKKEKFVPITQGNVGIYTCGPTVYDYIHIGNLRAFFLSDILRRTLEQNGYVVRQIMNITDVGIGGDNDEGEDKMTKGLKREGKPITLEAMKELGDFYTDRFKENIRALNVKEPQIFPKASEHIAEDIALVKTLEEKGFSYITNDSVYFDTSKDPHYGKLGGLSDITISESRIGIKSEKRNPRDFALWKFNDSIGYESPWGKGFPGWHIECSAMSTKYLGNSFDIHTGGIDLAPVHHNNEIAQSENACDCTYATYWIHNAFVNVQGDKMAKSEGNFITLPTLIERGFSALAYRLWLLSAHYRTPVDFSWKAMEAAQNAYDKLVSHIKELTDVTPTEANSAYMRKFIEYVNDDLDTPKALALMWDAVKDRSLSPAEKKATLFAFDEVLGLGLPGITKEEIPAEIEVLAQKREEARRSKEWAQADELRAEIVARGYEVKDTDTGFTLLKRGN